MICLIYSSKLLYTIKPFVSVGIVILSGFFSALSDTPGHWQRQQTAASQGQEENQEHVRVGVICHDRLGNGIKFYHN